MAANPIRMRLHVLKRCTKASEECKGVASLGLEKKLATPSKSERKPKKPKVVVAPEQTCQKTVLCYGDSNTWGYESVANITDVEKRMPYAYRWTTLLGKQLGAGYRVVDNGLNGRTTAYNNPLITDYNCNGQADLKTTLLVNKPLDVIVLQLGINDLQGKKNVSAKDVVTGLQVLLDEIMETSNDFPNGFPTVVVASCPTCQDTICTEAWGYENIHERSIEIQRQMKLLCSTYAGVQFVDLSLLEVGPDGLHYTRKAHSILAMKLIPYLVETIRSI